jgi:hypothetical protein
MEMAWGKWRLAWRIVSVCGLNLLVAWLFLVASRGGLGEFQK